MLSPCDFLHVEPGSVDNGGDLVWTFTTNRSWGERSDDALSDRSETGEPIVDTTGFERPTGDFRRIRSWRLGAAMQQGWQLHFENYGATDFNVDGIEIAWHGSPIAANSQRVQGFVGIDDNRDDLFNFSRVIQSTSTLTGDPERLRFGEVVERRRPHPGSVRRAT